MFGDKFYLELKKLSPWRQSLYALTLAERAAPDVELYCSMSDRPQFNAAYRHMLGKLWEFHSDKFNHIALDELVTALEGVLPEDDESNGALFAINAAICLKMSARAITDHMNDAAKTAALTALSSVVLVEEDRHDHSLSEEELRECESIDREIDYQVGLFNLIRKSARGPEIIVRCNELGFNEGVSAIGIPREGSGAMTEEPEQSR